MPRLPLGILNLEVKIANWYLAYQNIATVILYVFIIKLLFFKKKKNRVDKFGIGVC